MDLISRNYCTENRNHCTLHERYEHLFNPRNAFRFSIDSHVLNLGQSFSPNVGLLIFV